MSSAGLSNTGFDFALLDPLANGVPSSLSGAGSSTAGASASSFALYLADFRAQTFGSLMRSTSSGGNAGSSTTMDALVASLNASTPPLSSPASGSGVNGLSAAGRNATLFDPESAYTMMSFINTEDVAFKAEFSELSQMESSVAEMQKDGESLGGIKPSTANDSIKSQLQSFVSQYNAWIQRFDADMQPGGILADTRAAQVSRYELDQSIENVFNGAGYGLHGLSDLGVSIDPKTRLASFDPARLDAVLASNKQGAVNTLQTFAANFAKSAELLDSAGNFILNRLDNLDRAIHYIDANNASLQAEFGLGDTAKPSDRVAQALAAYNRTDAI